MNTGKFFIFNALVYIILLMFIYFSKRRYKSKENKIYSILIITSFIGVLLELGCRLTIPLLNEIPKTTFLITKLYLVYLLTWVTLLSLYTFIIVNKSQSKFKHTKISIIITYIINIIIIFYLPINYYNDGELMYTYGLSVYWVYIVSFVYIIISIINILLSKTNLKDKKLIPIIAFIIIGTITTIIQLINPGMLLVTSMETFVTVLMYFTIENPDVKMNTELAKNRNLIQNAMEEKNNFLFIVSTSLRNTINNLNELSLNVIKKDSKGLFKEDLLEINNEIKYLSFTINDVLNVSTMDINEIKIIENKYNLKKLIEKIKLVNKAKVNDNLNFRVEFSSSLPDYFYGDKTLLSLVITSLLNNAFKYTETGFVELRINGIVKYDMCRLIITIEDSGCGISISKINELLTDKNITKKELERLDTNDLNINLIKKIIKKMGGYFIIKSKVGFGTEVKFVLDQKIIGHNDNNNIIINNNKVLVATSDINLFKIINKYLENNYLVEKSLYEQDIIDKIKNKQEYKYILIDDNLDTRALPILNKIKTLNNKIPIIVILDKDTSVIKKQFLKDGFSDYILRSNIESDIKKLL